MRAAQALPHIPLPMPGTSCEVCPPGPLRPPATQELARRCDTLIRLVEKENEELEAKEKEEKRKSGKSGSKVRRGVVGL